MSCCLTIYYIGHGYRNRGTHSLSSVHSCPVEALQKANLFSFCKEKKRKRGMGKVGLTGIEKIHDLFIYKGTHS